MKMSTEVKYNRGQNNNGAVTVLKMSYLFQLMVTCSTCFNVQSERFISMHWNIVK